MLLYDTVHLHTKIVREELHRAGLHGDTLKGAGNGNLMNAELIGDLRIAQALFQPFFLENVNIIHTAFLLGILLALHEHSRQEINT